ncbi:MAG: EAL domain-containing protein, partial [Gemmatirosa sp.]|nr:EAL domain-containing protein [Gemmatirosa sp.]
TRRYLVVFAIAVGATVGGQLLVQQAYRRQAPRRWLLVQVQHQRLLAERLTGTGYALGHARTPNAVAEARQRFAEALADFRRASDIDLNAAPSDVRRDAPDGFGRVSIARGDMLATGADVELLARGPRTARRDSALVDATSRLAASQVALGTALGDAGRAILIASTAEMVDMRRLEMALLAAMLVALAVGALVIVRPATRHVERLVREVLASREALAEAHAATLREREFAASLVASAPDGIFAFDVDHRVTEWNPAMERWTGVPRAHALGRRPEDFEADLDWGDEGRPYARALAGASTTLHARQGRATRGGPSGFFDVACVPIRGSDGGVAGGQVTIRDVTERVTAQARVSASEARLRAMFNQADIGITFIDDAGIIHDTNPAFERLLGWTSDELRGRVASTLSPPEDAAVTRGPVSELRAGRRDSVTVEKRFLRSDGETVWCSLTISRLNADGDAATMVGLMYDVTARKELETRLSHQAYHDPLTGLANRVRLRDRIDGAMANGRVPEGLAVVYVDLDDFKKVNDSLGHAAGDALLRTVAERLLNATRGSDTVARLGGDEFAILLENVRTDEDVCTVAERVVRAMRAPITVEGKEVFIGASVGMARGGTGTDAPTSADALLRNADVAMYRAKGNGKGRHAMYEPGMREAALERLELEAGLRHAVERRELRLQFQPIVELDGEHVVGVEALVRWQHPTLGLLPPLRFIPIAEETGLIVPLGRWVLREACRHGAGWIVRHAAGSTPLTLTVNVSPRQLQDRSFVDDVEDVLTATRFPAERLLLELTESVFMQADDRTLATLHALKALGVRLAIDDFGTGYSSLAYLQQFPLDVLKIDRRFVDGMTRGGSEAALARTIIALGDSLSLRTVAEGVARPQQQEQLRALGCAYGQGFLFAHPLDAPDITRLLEEGRVGEAA